jgi:hypothetical protein
MENTALQTIPQQHANIVNIEDQAMSIDSLLGQVKLIQDVMEQVMKKDEHYGIIPGTKKPTLLKPGAEKLCLTFRLNPDYQIIREARERDFIAYTVKCDLTHIPTSQNIASGIGSCNSREAKYRYRFIEESTGVPVPKKYWDAKKAGDSKEMKRFLTIPHIPGEMRAAKIDGQWVIAKAEKVENDNPWDLDNTIVKMACKRALIAATLNATAASDIFTQDTDDLPPEILNGEKRKSSPKGSNGNKPQSKKEPEPFTDNQLKAIRGKISQLDTLSNTEKDDFYQHIKDKKAETMQIDGKSVITKESASNIIETFDTIYEEYVDQKTSSVPDDDPPWERDR